MMKLSLLGLAMGLASQAALAAPAGQLGAIENGLESGSANACPDAILIFARGSTEPGNMGITVGPALANGLESHIRNIWIQGVGGPYDAALATNFLPRGTSQANIDEGKRLFALANQKCPNTPVVAGGYSQGAALIAAAVSELSGAVKEQVKGVALFGYTQNLQNRGGIPNYPRERTKVFCNVGDAVCTGTLIITPAHLSYTIEARGEAARFLRDRIRAGHGPDPEPSPSPSPSPSPTDPDEPGGPTNPPTNPGGEYTEIALPFSYDGAGEYYWKTDQFSTDPNDWSRYVNSWNLDLLEINGTDYTNVWVAQHQIPAASDGYWYIHYKSGVSWGHVEIKGHHHHHH